MFIHLTIDQRKLAVNTNQIVFMTQRNDENKTVVQLTGGHDIVVRESIDQILELIPQPTSNKEWSNQNV